MWGMLPFFHRQSALAFAKACSVLFGNMQAYSGMVIHCGHTSSSSTGPAVYLIIVSQVHPSLLLPNYLHVHKWNRCMDAINDGSFFFLRLHRWLSYFYSWESLRFLLVSMSSSIVNLSSIYIFLYVCWFYIILSYPCLHMHTYILLWK